MTDLAQAAFRAALTDPRQPVPEGLTDPSGRPAGRRFDVYRNNVTASLSAALAEAFPALQSLLGAANFAVLARAFLRAHPPGSPILARYGAQMPSFLETFPHTKTLPYLPDVARLEQAMRLSYHAADSEPADLSPLASLPPDAIGATRLGFAPAMQLIRSRWPVLQVYGFALRGGAKPQMQAEDVLLLRPEYDPAPHLLPAGGADAVAALMDGATLSEAAAAGQDRCDSFDLQSTLSLLIAGRAITHLHLP